MSTYPDLESVIKGSDNQRLLEVRRTPLSLLSLISVFILSVVVAYGLIAVAHHAAAYIAYIPLVNQISSRLWVLIPILVLLEILRRLHNDLYIFAQHRLTHQHGRLSLAYNVSVIKYIDIRAINVLQDFWGRVFDYGDVIVGTAAHDGNELLIIGVKSPAELASLLDKLRSNSLKVESKEVGAKIAVSAGRE